LKKITAGTGFVLVAPGGRNRSKPRKLSAAVR